MPRKITPPRRRRTDDSELDHILIPTSIQMQTLTFDYKQMIKRVITWVIVLAVIVCSVLFCGIQDTLRYLEFIIVLLGTIVITWVSIMKSDE